MEHDSSRNSISEPWKAVLLLCSALGYLVKSELCAQPWALGKHLCVCWAGGRLETVGRCCQPRAGNVLCWGRRQLHCPRSSIRSHGSGDGVCTLLPSAAWLWALPPTAWPLHCKCPGFGAVVICACKFAPGIYCKHATDVNFKNVSVIRI